MSKSTPALIFAAAFSAFTAAAATPSAAPGEALNHFGTARDYSAWSLSAYASSATKNFKNHASEFDFTRVSATLGYSLTRSFTLYASAGMMDQDAKGPAGGASDKSAVFSAGAWFNILDIDQLSFFENVDRYSLSAGVEGTVADNDIGSYATVDGFLFFEVQGDVGKRAFIFPRTVGIFAGPVFSYSVSSDYETSSDDAVGFGAGVSVMFTDDVALRIGGDFYSNDSAAYAQFGINF